MLWMPHRVSDALQAPHLHRVRDVVLTHVIPATLDAIGDQRLAWLRALRRRFSTVPSDVLFSVFETTDKRKPKPSPVYCGDDQGAKDVAGRHIGGRRESHALKSPQPPTGGAT
jgi:hypothetical protein